MPAYDTLLVVDDNPAVQTALRICLGGVFRRVLCLSSPDALLSLLQQEPVDVVLLDMNFSLGTNTGQEGLFWLRTLRRRHPHIPVVLLTAYADVRLAVQGLKLGAADFVTKPWDNSELARTLAGAIEARDQVATLGEMEADYIRRVVDRCHGNISRAATLLGITRQTLYAKMRKP